MHFGLAWLRPCCVTGHTHNSAASRHYAVKALQSQHLYHCFMGCFIDVLVILLCGSLQHWTVNPIGNQSLVVESTLCGYKQCWRGLETLVFYWMCVCGTLGTGQAHVNIGQHTTEAQLCHVVSEFYALVNVRLTL